jgi:hypothetical protein
MSDDDLIQLVRDADPLAPGHPSAHADALLADILRTPRRPPRRRRSLATRLALAGTAAAVVAAAAIALTGGGGGDVTPASAAVVRRALAAVATPAGSILHVDVRGRQWGAGTPTITWRDQSWEQTGAPHDRRQVQTDPDGTTTESGNVGDAEQVYDPATDTIYMSPAAPAGDQAARQAQHAYVFRAGPRPNTYTLRLTLYELVKKGSTAVPHARHQLLVVTSGQAAALKAGTATIRWKRTANGHGLRPSVATRAAAAPAAPDCSDVGSEDYGDQILTLLRSCGARLVGHATVDGRDTLELRSHDGHMTYYIDADTYAPVRLDTRGTDGGTSLRFVTWELLPGGGANDALLSLSAQHPSATVARDAADNRAAEQRLFPHG